MAGVRLEHVSKQFNNTPVLKDIDLTIPDGVFCVVLGPSGCGKSTLLNLIAGLEQVNEGKIFIGDLDVTRIAPQKRNIAMVFQSYALYPHLSVFENIAFGLRARGEKETLVRAKVDEAARILNLADKLGRLPRELSGGERQRVATGRAIVRSPELFLFDEPLSNLDARLRIELREEFIKLHRRLNRTIIYVTHDQVEAQALGEMVVVMDKGVIQQVGGPRELYDRPANLFVARFIGSPPMNVLEVKVEEEGRTLVRKGRRISVPALETRLCGYAGSIVHFGFRPSGARLQSDAPLKAEVEFTETIGEEAYCRLRLLWGDEVTVKVPEDRIPAPRTQTGIEFLPDKVYVFQAAQP